MKEDYLWDKTGTDPAIKKLENALRVFSYEEGSLQLPVRQIEQVERPRFFRFLSLGFAAAAACVGLAVISWAIWGRTANLDTASIPDQTLSQQEGPTSGPEPAVIDNPGTPVEAQSDPPARLGGSDKRTFRNRTRPVAVPARTKRKPFKGDLTKEEIYAYNRLMLALSITSDKLNLVKEKITGE